ncbi:MAG TPA: hypothetical protein VFP68_07070 [Burkholderiaceae bacterium]|nr:hypothetical protein [Burkholderiaceae bacterium]
MRMRQHLLAIALALGGSAAHPQSVDPLQSPECRRAMEGLRTEEAAAESEADGQTREALRKRLQAPRRAAALACLGGRPDPPLPPQRMAQPPASVTLVPVPSAAAPAARPSTPPPAIPRPAPPPPMVTACDATGCWASDGTRLQRAGPLLLGPRGPCNVQGVALHCP